MPKNKNVIIKYTSRDFQSIKQDLVDYAQRYYSEGYRDFTEASFGSMMIDTVAYIGDTLSYYLDYNVNESFLDTSLEYENVRKHAAALGYNFSGTPSSYGIVSIFIIVPANSDGTAPDTSYLQMPQRISYQHDLIQQPGQPLFSLLEHTDKFSPERYI